MKIVDSLFKFFGFVREATRDPAAADRKLLQQGFRRLTTASKATTRDLEPLRQDIMLKICYYLWEANPIARWIVNIYVDFCVGEKLKIESEDEGVDEVLKIFIEDPVNKLNRRFRQFFREYGLNGELILPVAVNEVDGRVRLGYIDPQDVYEIQTDPDNVLIKRTVVLKAKAADQKKRYFKVIREDDVRDSETFGKMIGLATENERPPNVDQAYEGACFLWQANNVSNSTRGRSDLIALMDWLDGYDAFLYDSMDAANLFNSFVYDATLEGFSDEQVKAWLKDFGNGMKRGQVFAHNEKVKVTEVTPDLKAIDKDAFARLYRGHMLGSVSMPEHWYGLAGEVNFASAKEMGLPPVKSLSARQEEARWILMDMLTFVIHQAQIRGRLKQTVVIGRVAAAGDSKGVEKRPEETIKLTLPEISMKDQAAIVAAVTTLSTALVNAQMQGWLRPETAGRVFCYMLQQLGIEVDPKDEITAGGPNAAGAMADYSQVNRLIAQLGRKANGNGDNINEPKPPARAVEEDRFALLLEQIAKSNRSSPMLVPEGMELVREVHRDPATHRITHLTERLKKAEAQS